MSDYNGSAEQEKATESGQTQNKKIRGKKRALSRSQVLTRFTSCGRCSLFLAAYKIEYENQALEEAIVNSGGSWLDLPWNPNLRRLIVKSYGCHLDTEVYFFESCCPECLGKYRYSVPEDDGQSFLSFKI